MTHKMHPISKAVLAVVFTAVSFSTASAQEVEAMNEMLEAFGAAIQPEPFSYTGEQIETENGRIISYRISNPYDNLEAADGSNATFVDMKTGATSMVLPPNSPKMIFFLSIIYSDERVDGEQIGIGYVARVGSKKDYDNGRLDAIVGRFSDLEQQLMFKNVRYIDAPTAIDSNSISMLVWPQNEKANFTVIDLSAFQVTESTNVDLPKPVEIIRCPCACENGEIGENIEIYSPFLDNDAPNE